MTKKILYIVFLGLLSAFSFYLLEVSYYYFTHNPLYVLNIFPQGGYLKKDPNLGLIGNGRKNIRVLRTRSKKLIADVTYNMNDHYRVVPKTPLLNVVSDHSYFFYGGSYMFGMGLNDIDTLPAQFQALKANANVYNLGISGWGIHQLLYLIQQGKLDSYFNQNSNNTVIYGLMRHHIHRANHDLSALSHVPWNHSTPTYRFNDEGSVIYLGPYRQAYPTLSYLGETLNRSTAIRKLLSFTAQYNYEEKEKLFCGIIQSISIELKKRNINFVTFSYNDLQYVDSLKNCLQRNGQYISLGDKAYVENRKYRLHDRDHHPSALFNKFLAEKLSGTL